MQSGLIIDFIKVMSKNKALLHNTYHLNIGAKPRNRCTVILKDVPTTTYFEHATLVLVCLNNMLMYPLE